MNINLKASKIVINYFSFQVNNKVDAGNNFRSSFKLTNLFLLKTLFNIVEAPSKKLLNFDICVV